MKKEQLLAYQSQLHVTRGQEIYNLKQKIEDGIALLDDATTACPYPE